MPIMENVFEENISSPPTLEKAVQEIETQTVNRETCDFSIQADLITDEKPQIQNIISNSKEFKNVETQAELPR